MNALALKTEGGQAVTLFATVTGALDARLLVRSGDAVRPARRAAGCLLEPQTGDRVLVAQDASGEAYVLAVLARASDQPGRVGLAEGFILEAPEGRVEIAGREVAVTAQDTLTLSGRRLNQTFARIRTAAGAVERVLGRVVERVSRVYRRVDESEDVRAGSYTLNASEALRLDGGTVSVRAEGTVDLDGKKIRLG